MELKHRLANLLSHIPQLTKLAVKIFRLTRPRFTSGVVGVVFNAQGELLIVKHVFHPEHPWGLPGGWQEAREMPVQTVQRELKEELSLEVDVRYPLLIENWKNRRHLDIAYLCTAKNDVQGLCAELTDYQWCRPEERPALYPFHERAIQAALAPRD